MNNLKKERSSKKEDNRLEDRLAHTRTHTGEFQQRIENRAKAGIGAVLVMPDIDEAKREYPRGFSVKVGWRKKDEWFEKWFGGDVV